MINVFCENINIYLNINKIINFLKNEVEQNIIDVEELDLNFPNKKFLFIKSFDKDLIENTYNFKFFNRENLSNISESNNEFECLAFIAESKEKAEILLEEYLKQIK